MRVRSRVRVVRARLTSLADSKVAGELLSRKTGCGLRFTKAAKCRESVEARVKTQDPVNFMVLHNSKMHGVSCGYLPVAYDNFPRTLCNSQINRKSLLGDAEQSVKRGLDGITPINRCVTVQNLLQGLGIAKEALAFTDQSLQ
jgi:hypothetical protein